MIDPTELWAGDFGDEYITRNEGTRVEAASLRLLANAVGAEAIGSVLEIGANVGINLQNMRRLFPDVELSAIEVNAKACSVLRSLGIRTYESSLVDFRPPETYDLSMSLGVLIHIHPQELAKAYELLHGSSRRFILLAEYYSPFPTAVSYRGYEGALWKRDFAGEMLDLYRDLELRDVGFAYHRQSQGSDDLTWFLLEKRPAAK